MLSRNNPEGGAVTRAGTSGDWLRGFSISRAKSSTLALPRPTSSSDPISHLTIKRFPVPPQCDFIGRGAADVLVSHARDAIAGQRLVIREVDRLGGRL